MDQHTKKLLIAFDARSAARSSRSGIGYYTCGAIQALNDYHGDKLQLVGHYYKSLSKNSPQQLPSGESITYVQNKFIPEKFVNLLRRIGLEIPFELLTRCRAAVHFFPDYLSHPSLFGTPAITTIHDLAYIDLPETVSARNRRDLTRFVPKSILRSRIIVTVSKTASKHIEETYSTSKPIVVTYTPPYLHSNTCVDSGETIGNLGITDKYILFLGTLEPRKNIVNLINAYSVMPQELQQEYKLVLAGGNGWNNHEIIAAIDKAKRRHLNIVTPGYVTETQRAVLYQNAAVFVFPSFYEGFGIPPLEAMAARVPVVASDLPVLREVCSNAALYCQPDDPMDISAKIQTVLTDATIRQSLIQKGSKRVANFTWREVADALYAAFLQALR